MHAIPLRLRISALYVAAIYAAGGSTVALAGWAAGDLPSFTNGLAAVLTAVLASVLLTES